MVKRWSPKPNMRVRFLLPLPFFGGYYEKITRKINKF